MGLEVALSANYAADKVRIQPVLAAGFPHHLLQIDILRCLRGRHCLTSHGGRLGCGRLDWWLRNWLCDRLGLRRDQSFVHVERCNLVARDIQVACTRIKPGGVATLLLMIRVDAKAVAQDGDLPCKGGKLPQRQYRSDRDWP